MADLLTEQIISAAIEVHPVLGYGEGILYNSVFSVSSVAKRKSL
jgi:hypothetical protein